MTAKTTTPDAANWARVIQFEEALLPAAARALLKLKFSSEDERRLRELASKARAGVLSPDEERESQAYDQLGCLLDTLHSKARRAGCSKP